MQEGNRWYECLWATFVNENFILLSMLDMCSISKLKVSVNCKENVDLGFLGNQMLWNSILKIKDFLNLFCDNQTMHKQSNIEPREFPTDKISSPTHWVFNCRNVVYDWLDV